jgi:NAD(P)-dependent dehydrogenase (short-subunit alcohol dehydrogenase family)
MSDEAKLARLDARFPLKRAVITGGASGLGLAAAEWLAKRGWRIALL